MTTAVALSKILVVSLPPFPLGPYPEASGYEEAVGLDQGDPLTEFRERFLFADPDLIYLDGNSLGRLPIDAGRSIDLVVGQEWGERLIRSWNERWWDLQVVLGDRIAPLVGAAPGQLIVSDSTSVNLYKLATAAAQRRPGRSRVVTDDLNFPSDVYVLGGVAEATGAELVVVPSDGISGPVVELESVIDENTALVSLSHTVFRSGYTYDLASVTAMAHRAGAMVLWDLSHSVGVVPIELDEVGADLAVGCTYKYLNGGPGSPAFLYVRSDLQESLVNPINAWWGHAEPFTFDLEFRPAAGIRKFHTGTMPILSLAAIEAGLADVIEAGIPRLRAKSITLSGFLVSQWEEHLAPIGFGLASPRDPERRGSHVSLSHPEAWPIARAMIETGKVLPDFRAPDNLRLGLAPLYTSHTDVHTAVHRIKTIVENGVHQHFRGPKPTVT
ncbi:MAG TPA: aminotransferase class V-fold PLP-dependent enzyme [Acidimicrobiia bacterium]|nr:aminotransferase class V-fold PLP-dependent enzyme [Acidimicrobiia bacterium]